MFRLPCFNEHSLRLFPPGGRRGTVSLFVAVAEGPWAQSVRTVDRLSRKRDGTWWAPKRHLKQRFEEMRVKQFSKGHSSMRVPGWRAMNSGVGVSTERHIRI